MGVIGRLGISLLGAAAACGYAGMGSGPGVGCTSSATQVCAANFAFSPVADTVTAGTTVHWMNTDAVSHTTTASAVPSGAMTWNETLAAGAQDSVTFSVAGTYEYYCRFHGSPDAGMHGTVVVR